MPATPMVVLPTKARIERLPEETLAITYPAKFGEHLKISFLFENKTHKFFRMDYYNTSNENRISRSYFVGMDVKTGIPVRMDYNANV